MIRSGVCAKQVTAVTRTKNIRIEIGRIAMSVGISTKVRDNRELFLLRIWFSDPAIVGVCREFRSVNLT